MTDHIRDSLLAALAELPAWRLSETGKGFRRAVDGHLYKKEDVLGLVADFFNAPEGNCIVCGSAATEKGYIVNGIYLPAEMAEEYNRGDDELLPSTRCLDCYACYPPVESSSPIPACPHCNEVPSYSGGMVAHECSGARFWSSVADWRLACYEARRGIGYSAETTVGGVLHVAAMRMRAVEVTTVRGATQTTALADGPDEWWLVVGGERMRLRNYDYPHQAGYMGREVVARVEEGSAWFLGFPAPGEE